MPIEIDFLGILDSIDEYISAFDKDWSILFVSKGSAEDFGFKQSELVGKNFWKLFPKFIGTELEKNYRTSMEKRVTTKFEWRTIYAKDRIREFTVSPSVYGITVYGKDITDRKKAEEALSQSEESFSKAFNISPAMLTIIRVADNRYVNVNDSFLELMGYKRDEVIGHTSRELNMFADPDKRDQIVSLALRQGGLRNQEIEVKTKSGQTLNVLYSLEAITINDEPHLIVNFIDITQRKKAEEALGESEHLYRTLFENTKDGFELLKVIYDKSGKANNFLLLNVNQAYESQTGLKASDVIGKLVTEYLPNLEPFWISFFANVARTGKAERVENYNANTNRWYDAYAFQYAKDQVGVLFSDISVRKKMEEQLKQRTNELALERERFFNMLENLPVMVCLITADYKIPFANRMFREKFGEAKGRCCYEYIGCVNAPCAMCESLVPLKTGKPHHWTASFSNGTLVDVHDFPFTDVDGTAMILEADVDITERVNLQKQLQEKERLAAIGATAGMVGHDIRNPLQAMIGDVYLMKDDIASAPECKTKEGLIESLRSIEENIVYVNKIVQDLQDYARPLSLEYSQVTLSDVLVKIFDNLKVPDSVKHSIKIEGLERLRTDHVLLQRALTNLVTNAIQAMPNGGVLKITGHSQGNKAVITVSDTGVGIPDELKLKLFTPMMTTKSKGQGFGLVVSKRLIEAMKGTITFESEEGKGTKFIINLPMFP